MFWPVCTIVSQNFLKRLQGCGKLFHVDIFCPRRSVGIICDYPVSLSYSFFHCIWLTKELVGKAGFFLFLFLFSNSLLVSLSELRGVAWSGRSLGTSERGFCMCVTFTTSALGPASMTNTVTVRDQHHKPEGNTQCGSPTPSPQKNNPKHTQEQQANYTLQVQCTRLLYLSTTKDFISAQGLCHHQHHHVQHHQSPKPTTANTRTGTSIL